MSFVYRMRSTANCFRIGKVCFKATDGLTHISIIADITMRPFFALWGVPLLLWLKHKWLACDNNLSAWTSIARPAVSTGQARMLLGLRTRVDNKSLQLRNCWFLAETIKKTQVQNNSDISKIT